MRLATKAPALPLSPLNRSTYPLPPRHLHQVVWQLRGLRGGQEGGHRLPAHALPRAPVRMRHGARLRAAGGKGVGRRASLPRRGSRVGWGPCYPLLGCGGLSHWDHAPASRGEGARGVVDMGNVRLGVRWRAWPLPLHPRLRSLGLPRWVGPSPHRCSCALRLRRMDKPSTLGALEQLLPPLPVGVRGALPTLCNPVLPAPLRCCPRCT